MNAPVLPKPGDVVAGKYRIEKIAGEGGMGIVFAAHHLVLDRRVALKVLLVDAMRGDETVERFVREAQAAARLDSEHVVRVMDAGSLENGLPFFVMEHLEGYDLDEMLTLEGPIEPTMLVDYTLQVLAALAQAHAAGIVHRDLKPANLFLAVTDDGRDIIKVLDFGISKQDSDRAHWKQLTGQGILGTPSYMSPEQLRSSKSVDARADIWSLGVCLYQLATGALPFDGDGPGEIFAAILEESPILVRKRRPDVPQGLEDIVMRCLHRDPEARFSNVGELAMVLAPLGSGQWTHLLSGIEQSLVRARRASQGNIALVDAAVAAAVTSRPAPPMSTGISHVLDVAHEKTEQHSAPGRITRREGLGVVVAAMTRRRPRTLWAALPLSAALMAIFAVSGRAHSGSSPGASSALDMRDGSHVLADSLALFAPVRLDAPAELATSTEAPLPIVTTRAPQVSKAVAPSPSRSKTRPKFLNSRD
jgi:serine/threonine-protein kinase